MPELYIHFSIALHITLLRLATILRLSFRVKEYCKWKLKGNFGISKQIFPERKD